MDKIRLVGGRSLKGEIEISGAKNSALKLMAAALLTDQPLELSHMPRLADTRFMGHLLAHLGVEVREEAGARLRLHAAEFERTEAPYELVRKMRATFNVLGPMLARERKARVSLPGGCAIGARPVNLHLEALKTLGAEIELSEGYVNASAPSGLVGGRVEFPFVSVGATEHTMLAATLARGESVLENCAREPEIADLADCLNAMGADVAGAGTSTIRVQGKPSLSGAEHAVVADRIEAGTYALCAASAGGEVELKGARWNHNEALWERMSAAGVGVSRTDSGVRVARNGGRCQAVDVETTPFPGFPTDLQAQFMGFMATCEGVSHIRETIFENRFMHAPELARMGADIEVKGREAIVRGRAQLTGAPVMATDLRASVSLIVAGLAANGVTEVSRVYHLDRGFERLEQKLSACGAEIERVADV